MAIIDQIPAPIKDAGEFLGLVKDKCKIGVNLELTLEVVSKHKVTRDYDVPDKWAESGYNFVDNIEDKPLEFSIQAISNEWDWRDKKRMLIQMAEAKKPVKFYSLVDKVTYENLAIKNLIFDPSYRQSNGFTAIFSLKKLRVAEASEASFGVDISPDKKKQTAQANALGSSGEVNPAKDGVLGKAFGPDGILKTFSEEGGFSGVAKFFGGF